MHFYKTGPVTSSISLLPKISLENVYLTSRDRPKSAPYPRLINSKKTSKCQVFSFTIHENQKFFEKITYSKNGPSGALKSHNAEKLNGQFGVFQHPFCRKTSKNWSGKIFIFGKNLTVPKKNWKGGPFGIFQHPFCRKTAKKLKGGTLWRKKNSGKKVSQCRKKLEGGTLWSPRVWYGTRENRKNLFGSVR